MKKTSIFILVIFLINIIFADEKGKITGTVIDDNSKEVLPGANVIVLETSYGASSDIDGDFIIDNLPAGTYRLEFSYIGYISEIVTDVVVHTSKPVFLKVELKPQILETEAITVTAGYFSEATVTQPSVIGLSREEIRRYPGGFEDVVRTVSTLPGVAINNAGGRNDLLVRGGGPSENLYIINNIEVPNINHFGTQGNSSGSLSFVNLDFVDNVSFSTGGFSARYGDKLSSVLSLSLTEGRGDRFGAKALISATQYGLNLEGPFGENGNFIFSARKSYLDLIFKAAGLPFVPVYTDYNFVANYRLSQTDRLFILGLAAIDNVERNQETEENRISNAQRLDNTQYQYVTGINYRKIHENGYADVTFNTNLYKYRFSQGDDNEIEYFKSRANEYEYIFKAQRFRSMTKNLNLLFGLVAKINQNKNTTVFADTIFDRNGRRLALNQLGIDPVNSINQWTQKYATFLEVDWSPISSIETNIGLRADYYSSLKKPIYLAPRIAFKYKINSEHALKLNYGYYYQSPSNVWLVNPANKDLKALQNRMAIIGWDYLIKEDIRFNVEVYYKDYHDLPTGIIPGRTDYLVLTNTGTNYGGREDDFQSFGYFDLVSEGKGYAYGAEITLQKKYSDIPLYGQISLSYGKSRVTAKNNKTYPAVFDQRFILNINGGYKFNSVWEASGKFRYFTGVPYTPVYRPGDNPVNPGFIQNLPDEYLSDRLAAGHHLDFRVDRYFEFSRWTLIVYVDVQNVYNYKIPIRPNYDFTDDEIVKSNSIGILPSIGISAEF